MFDAGTMKEKLLSVHSQNYYPGLSNCGRKVNSKHCSSRTTDKRSEISTRRGPALHKRLRSITQAVSKAKQRGDYSERIALAILCALVDAGELPAAVEPLKINTANSRRDRKGYDITYVTDRGVLDFQVKSSGGARRKFLEKHPHILCFVVGQPADEKLLAEQFMNSFWAAYEKLAD